jgi:hypothetical protein
MMSCATQELRAARFATRYNETWLADRHGYRTPAQVRADENTTADLRSAPEHEHLSALQPHLDVKFLAANVGWVASRGRQPPKAGAAGPPLQELPPGYTRPPRHISSAGCLKTGPQCSN